MFKDPSVKRDGQLGVAFGMNAGSSPREISPNHFAGGLNIAARLGVPHPRPGFPLLVNQGDLSGLTPDLILNADGTDGTCPFYTEDPTTGLYTTTLSPWAYSYNFPGTNIQGSCKYSWNGENYGIVVIDGCVYILRVSAYNYDLQKLVMANGQSQVLDPTVPVYMCQAENYMVIQDGFNIPVIYNGQILRQADYSTAATPEVPVGKMMWFIQGRLFVADGVELHAGDIQGGPTTVISFSEELIYSGNFSFLFPTPITGIGAAPKLDSATGWGELIVFTKFSTHAINAEVTDRSTWATSSIQRVVFANIGCESHFSIVVVGSDLYWRAVDGIRSFRNTTAAGTAFMNTLIATSRPVSVEVAPFLGNDRTDLLDRIQGCYVDNRLLMTCYPIETNNGGCSHYGMLSLDFKTTLTTGTGNSFGALNPAWDGMWFGIRPASFLQMIVDGEERTLALCQDADGLNRLWEIRPDYCSSEPEWIYDAELTSQRCPVQWMFDTRQFVEGSGFDPKRLWTLEQEYCNIWGEFNLALWYRADGDNCWHPFGQLSWNARDYQVGDTGDWEDLSCQHLPNVRPPTPDESLGESGESNRIGKGFQFRLSGSGCAWLYRLMPITKDLQDTTQGAKLMEAPSVPNIEIIDTSA